MTDRQSDGDKTAATRSPSPRERSNATPLQRIAGMAIGEGGLWLANSIYTLLAAALMAFASVFLLIGWYYGPQTALQAKEYRKLTSHVDARIVESWLALEFNAAEVRNPEFWRASTNVAGCVVAEYGGEWGTPLRRAFCGTRVPFHDSYPVAKLHDISEGIPFAWARDERGFAVPEIRVEPATRQWLADHVPNKFMHQKWPANTALDWLRLELDTPIDAAIAGWSAPAPILPLAYDPARPAEALPTGIVEKRMAQSPSIPGMIVGFGVGLFVWFIGAGFLPLLSDMAPLGRRILSALPLLTLPWWMDAFPQAMATFNRDIASLVGDVFADVGRTDRMVASNPAQATLAGGERLVWSLDHSAYADTLGRFRFAAPAKPVSKDAAGTAIVDAVTAQARTLDDGERTQLFVRLLRDKQAGLIEVEQAFKPAAKEAAADPAASAATRRAATRFLEWIIQAG